jgi:hypothetical protein
MIGRFLKDSGLKVISTPTVRVSMNGLYNKPHEFDWGNETLLVECKAYNWLPSGGDPNGKHATVNEAMLYFMATPESYLVKKLFLWKTEKAGKKNPETFAEQYVRRYGHFIPMNVEVYEFDDDDLSARCIWPPPSK